MFEETMSGNELLDEYLQDLEVLQFKTVRFDKSDYVSRYLWKRRKNPTVIITKVFPTLRGNTYLGILIYNQSGVGQSKQWNFTSFHIGLIQTSKGLGAIAFYAESKQAIKYNPHFFIRYKERYMEVCDWQTKNQLMQAQSNLDIIAVFMKRNLTMTWIETKSVFRNKVHIFGPINDGVALLQWDKHRKLLQANTFVSMDMLDAKQTEMVKYAKIYLSLSKEQRKKFQFPDFISND